MEKPTVAETCPTRSALLNPPPEIAATLSVLGGKWKILILWQLLRRPCRFNELRRAIAGISQHMLTVHLRELEQDRILTRTVFAEVPPRVEYALTEHGLTLGTVMKSLADWGESHLRLLLTLTEVRREGDTADGSTAPQFRLRSRVPPLL